MMRLWMRRSPVAQVACSLLLAGSFAATLSGGCSSDANTGTGMEPDGGSPGDPDGGQPPPPVSCTLPAMPADVSTPTTVVGSGTAASCTEAALAAALAQGGIITFSCGTSPYTLTVTSEKLVTKDTVLDGGGKVTLSGGGMSRILKLSSTYDKDTPSLTVQNLRFSGGSTKSLAGAVANGGGAIHRLGGKLLVINSTFDGNDCPQSGQDVAGGAIFSNGVGETVIVGSTFTNNTCSNGGAIGNLGNSLNIVNSSITGNKATGSGGNPGNGGNGGGVSVDGQGKTVSLCGVTLSGNQGKAFGGGLFRVSYQKESTNINASTVDGNSIPDVSGQPSMAGGLYLQGTTANISATTISNNSARGAGGIFMGPLSIVSFTNDTISGNTATASLGGGLVLSDNPNSNPVSGTILNCTIANNRAPGTVAFGGGVAGGLDLVKLQNSIVANNVAGNAYNPINCTKKLGKGGPNIQNPAKWASGADDATQAPCADGVTVVDPKLGQLADNTGPTKTQAPAADSPALGKGTGCPATDQRGRPRASMCTLGAVE